MALNPLSSANNGLNDLGLRSGLSQMAGKLNNAAEKIKANGLGVEKSSNQFQKVINSSSLSKENNFSPERMQERLADIRQLGAALKKYFSPGVVSDYLVTTHSFLTVLQEHSFEGQNDEEGLFEKLNIVSEELDNISAEFFKEQRDELKIVASLDLVEGMLVDVMA